MSQGRIVPGIDTPPADHLALIKADIASDDREEALRALQSLNTILTDLAALQGLSSPLNVSSHSWDTTALVGFSARFFKGPFAQERDTRKRATRFAITTPVPPGLQLMYARNDDRFAELRTEALIGEKESDLIIACESSDQVRLDQLVSQIVALACHSKLRCKSTHWGARLEDGRDHLGFKDGVSNLQDVRAQHAERYRRYVYVHDGEAGTPAYDGGTYLVFRKYREHLARWFAAEAGPCEQSGVCQTIRNARERIIGRSCQSHLVIDGQTGEYLPPEFDEAQGARAFDASHIRKANPRGKGKTNFGASVLVKDARILRRGFPFTDISLQTGEKTQGLLFLCFQSNIQQRGFEFIHNEWLMSAFMGGRDPLLDPDAGFIEPIDGCYYFIPPVHQFPGDVFFA